MKVDIHKFAVAFASRVIKSFTAGNPLLYIREGPFVAEMEQWIRQALTEIPSGEEGVSFEDVQMVIDGTWYSLPQLRALMTLAELAHGKAWKEHGPIYGPKPKGWFKSAPLVGHIYRCQYCPGTIALHFERPKETDPNVRHYDDCPVREYRRLFRSTTNHNYGS